MMMAKVVQLRKLNQMQKTCGRMKAEVMQLMG